MNLIFIWSTSAKSIFSISRSELPAKQVLGGGDRAAVSEHWSEPDIETDWNENNKLNINSNYKIERLVSVNLKVKFWLADVVHDIMKPKALRLHPVPDDTGWGVCSLRFELSGLSWLSAHEPLW